MAVQYVVMTTLGTGWDQTTVKTVAFFPPKKRWIQNVRRTTHARLLHFVHDDPNPTTWGRRTTVGTRVFAARLATRLEQTSGRGRAGDYRRAPAPVAKTEAGTT